jgi:hypothetical protein
VATVVAGSCLVALSSGPDSGAGAPSGAGSGASQSPGATGIAGLTGDSGTSALSLAGQRPTAIGPVPLPSASGGAASSGQQSGDGVPRLVVPDVIASVPGGVTAQDVAKIKRIGQVLAAAPIAGARITVNGKPETVLGAPASAIRRWMPPATAADQALWTAFGQGDLITTTALRRGAGLRADTSYPVTAAVRTQLRYGTSALLGVAGVDGIVNETQARRLGLVRDVAVLINAPAANLVTLVSQVRAALGQGSQVIRLVPVSVSTQLPVDTHAPTGRPASYLDLYRESAAQYCPGLSWTVLAAIGQIESGNGVNVGPSSAGALGPMQFLPSTWKIWGVTAFGETGAPDIMDPFDAVPSAARMLCADGAAGGGQQLRQAIFDYNHATWYVDEVLTLANEYASEFG